MTLPRAVLLRPTKTIAVLGGGITGLTAAWRLSALGHQVRLFEQTGRLGGAVRTEMADGWLVEAGPNSFQEDSLALRSLLDELKISKERVYAPEGAKRYLVRRGRLEAAPRSPLGFLASPLLSPLGKLRAAVDLLHWRGCGLEDCSLADFIRSHLGAEALERLAQPLVSGVCAGDPEKLSARHAFERLWEMDRRFGSLIRGARCLERSASERHQLARPRTASFQRGLQTLYHALVLQLPAGVISTNARVEVLRPGPDGWTVLWRELRNVSGSPRADGPAADDLQAEPVDLVVCALPPAALARLAIGANRERPLAALSGIDQPPLASLFLGYRREQVAHPLDGFGFLAPRIERRAALGVVFSSSLFPNRAPSGHVALTVMAGGALQRDLGRLPAEELLAAVRPDLEQLLGVRGAPVFLRHHPWPQSIPQYHVGHARHLETVRAVEKAHPGLFIGGQAVDGISLPASIRAGDRLAQRLAQSEYRQLQAGG